MKFAAGWVMQSEDRLHELWHIMQQEDGKRSERAAWLWSTIFDKDRSFVAPLLPNVARLLMNTSSVPIKRNLARTLSMSPLPEDQMGLLFDFAFQAAFDGGEAIAVRVHCLEIVYQITNHEPELKEELLEAINHEIDRISTGYKSRATHIRKRLQKELGMR